MSAELKVFHPNPPINTVGDGVLDVPRFVRCICDHSKTDRNAKTHAFPNGEGGNANALTDEVDEEESLCVVALSLHRHPAVPLPFQGRLALCAFLVSAKLEGSCVKQAGRRGRRPLQLWISGL